MFNVMKIKYLIFIINLENINIFMRYFFRVFFNSKNQKERKN